MEIQFRGFLELGSSQERVLCKSEIIGSLATFSSEF